MARQTLTPQAVRRFTLGSGPLKRASDRLELLSRIVLVAVLLTGVAVALAVGTSTYTDGRPEIAAQVAERRQVNAQLYEDVAVPAGSGDGARVGQASAVWTAPSGVKRTGPVPARIGAEAGSTVLIWVDRDGDRTTRPISNGDVASRAFGTAFVTYVGISAVALGAHLAVRRLLDRSRLRRWAAEWALVGPLWTGRVP